jgi:hypothetical protein
MSEISVVVTSPSGSPDSVTVNVGDQTAGGGNGQAATIQVGTVTTLGATQTAAYVINSGTAYAAKLDFGIPRAASNSLSIGSVTSGTAAKATITGTAPSQTISFVIPAGATGATGPANSLSVGSVTTGTTAAVSISGSAPSQVISFVLQPGPKGDTGTAGVTNMSDATPSALGTASAGTSSLASRGDHVHALPVISYTALSNVPTTFSPATHTQTASTISDFATQAAKYGPVISVNGLTGAVTITGGTSGATLSDVTPAALGTASAGTSSLASRSDHVHQLPVATTSSLGAVTVGSGLSVSSGSVSANVLSVQGRTGSVVITTAELSAVTSIVTGVTGTSAVTNIVSLSAAQYAALTSYGTATLYVVTG